MNRAPSSHNLFTKIRAWFYQRGLRFKLLLIVVGLSLLVMVFLSLLLYNLQRQQLIENAQESTNLISNMLEANLQHAMLTREVGMINGILSVSRQSSGLSSISILNDKGEIKFNTDLSEVNVLVPLTDPVCQNCHAGPGQSVVRNAVVLEYPQPRLLFANPVLNRPQCYECHSAENRVLGLILTETSLSGVYDQFAANFWQVTLLVLLALGLMIVLIIPALEQRIIKPVHKLQQAVEDISAGKTGELAGIRQHDEIGGLAQSFGRMSQRLQQSLAERDERENDLDILFKFGLSATQLHDLDKILDFALNTIVDQFGMSDTMIFLWNESQQRYSLRAWRGMTPEKIEQIDQLRRSGFDFIQQVAESGVELYVPNIAQDDHIYLVWDEKERSYVAFPLVSRGRVIGVVETVSQPGHIIAVRELELLKAVGRQIGSAVDNAILLESSYRNEVEAKQLYRLGTTISFSLALKEVLEQVAQAALELVPADASLVALADAQQQTVEVQATAGMDTESYKGKRNLISKGSQGFQLLLGKPIFSHHAVSAEFSGEEAYSTSNEAEKVFMTVPLTKSDHLVGCIELIRHNGPNFSEAEANLMERFCNHAVIVIDNAILYRKLRYVSALEEQSRLARELHDHLAQTLGYLNIKTSLTDEQLLQGKIEEARGSLQELKAVTKNIYIDVREGIFNLRTSASTYMGFLPYLRSYLVEYRQQYGLNVHLYSDLNDELDLSAEIANQLMRIVQEALTNIRKHAHASDVSVRVNGQAETLIIIIADNGTGFDLGQSERQQHFGLQIMRERAETVGGKVNYQSEPGKGTQVIIEMPIHLRE